MKKVLVDGNLLLEFCIVPNKDTKQLMEIWKSHQIELYLTDQCLEKIRFYAKKENIEYAEELISILENELRIITITNEFINKAKKLSLPNFESSIEIICAIDNQLDAIITGNRHNFNGTDFPIWSAENLPSLLHLSKCLSLEIDLSGSFYETDTGIPSFHSMEATGIMKYHIRHTIATVIAVFRLIEEEEYEGISRQKLQEKYNYRKGCNYSLETINSIIWDLQNFHMVTIQSGKVVIQPYLLDLDNISIANHIAKFLNQHIVVQTIYKQTKNHKCFTRTYLQKMIMQLKETDKEIKNPINNDKGEFISLPLGFNVYIENSSLANKSASDYISRMLGWLLFAGLLEKNKATIIIPIKEGKQKGQLIEENSSEQIDSIHKQLDLF
jgi:hypothetical protein